MEKQTQKKVGVLKSLNPFNKRDELKKIECIFSQNLMNGLLRAKLKEIVNLQDIIKTDELNYKLRRKKVYYLSEYSLRIVFQEIYIKGSLSLKDADNESSNFAAKIKKIR